MMAAAVRLPRALVAVSLIGFVLWDAFEAIVLPRRVTRRWRMARLSYRLTWMIWSGVARRIQTRARRESYLGIYGPLSLLLLLALWAASLVLGFGALHWSLGTTMHTPGEPPSFGTYLYLSGTTFFTLGLGDITPRGPLARGLTALESGVGFGFLALVIGYFPVLYQAFSRREVSITLLDPRAGHAVVDLARVFRLTPRSPSTDRLPPAELVRLVRLLAEAGRPATEPDGLARRLVDLRRTYEPYVSALADHLLMPLPAWTPGE